MQEVGINCSSLDVGSGKGGVDLSSLLQFNAVLVVVVVVVVVAFGAKHHPGLDGTDWKQKFGGVNRVVTQWTL